MNDEYVAHARDLATRLFQTFSALQLNEIEPPASRAWADVENIRISEEIAWLADAATALAEQALRDLGVDPEPLRLQAEASLESGAKLPIAARSIASWTEGLGQRLLFGLVLQVRLEAIFGSSYLRLATVAHELYFKFCQRDWPAVVGSPHRERVLRAIEEEGLEALQQAVDTWWPLAVASVEDPAEQDAGLIRLGLKTRDNAFARASLVHVARRELQAVGLRIPA